MQETPLGFRFRPTEEELVFYYLHRKVNGEPLPPNVVTDCEIYCDKEPWQIFDNNSNERFYVFTKLKRRSKARIERAVGCGTWKGQNKTEIMDGEKHVGYKKLLVFEAKDAMATNGHWIMHEFSLLEGKFNDFVLCEIRNASSSGSKDHGQVKRSRNDDELMINEVTLQPQVENEDISFQNMCQLWIPELWEEENQQPKRRRLITSLTEEAPTENLVSRDPARLLEVTQPQHENQDSSIDQEMIHELLEGPWDNLVSSSCGVVDHPQV
ncbi:hypothetical protein SLA2020_413240 [Shorea laevis]